MAIRPGFLPAAPGWVRWPLYVASFVLCWGVALELMRLAVHSTLPRGTVADRTISIVLWIGLGRSWFKSPAIIPPQPAITDPAAPTGPIRTPDPVVAQVGPVWLDRLITGFIIGVAVLAAAGLLGAGVYAYRYH